MLTRIYGVKAENIPGKGSALILTSDAAQRTEALAREMPGSVSLIYMDPPFATGKRFEARLRVGKEEWKTGRGSLSVPAYNDNLPRDEYLTLMRRVLTASRELLTPDGLIYLHVDYRMHARLRLIADDIFGEKNFINEIIWAYETGGRSKNFFSRKHDIILLYSKSEEYDLHIDDVACAPAGGRKNHMARKIDEDGRVYRTITSGGKTYRYFDDEPVAPSDVWCDVSHLQQKDPRRLGYDTQKPLKLLERIVLSSSRPGETVLDPFMGSGTTAEAALIHGRSFIGIDTCPLSPEYVRRRAEGYSCRFEYEESVGEPPCAAETVPGIAYTAVYLNAFGPCDAPDGRMIAFPDSVDSWAVGSVTDGVFTCISSEMRSFRTPELGLHLDVPIDKTDLALRITDVLGNRFYYALPDPEYI